MADVGDDSKSEGSWGRVASGFTELGDRLRSGFDDLGDRDSATREEIGRAWAGFATAAQGLGQALVICLSANRCDLPCSTCHRRLSLRRSSLRSASSAYRCGYAFVGGPCEERRCRRIPRRRFTDRPRVTTVNDPEIRTGVKQAFGSLIDAVGTTVRDTAGSASARARRMRGAEDDQ